MTSLALGGYGAALSTYLAVLKFKEGSRFIRLFVRMWVALGFRTSRCTSSTQVLGPCGC